MTTSFEDIVSSSSEQRHRRQREVMGSLAAPPGGFKLATCPYHTLNRGDLTPFSAITANANYTKGSYVSRDRYIICRPLSAH